MGRGRHLAFLTYVRDVVRYRLVARARAERSRIDDPQGPSLVGLARPSDLEAPKFLFDMHRHQPLFHVEMFLDLHDSPVPWRGDGYRWMGRGPTGSRNRDGKDKGEKDVTRVGKRTYTGARGFKTGEGGPRLVTGGQGRDRERGGVETSNDTPGTWTSGNGTGRRVQGTTEGGPVGGVRDSTWWKGRRGTGFGVRDGGFGTGVGQGRREVLMVDP